MGRELEFVEGLHALFGIGTITTSPSRPCVGALWITVRWRVLGSGRW